MDKPFAFVNGLEFKAAKAAALARLHCDTSEFCQSHRI